MTFDPAEYKTTTRQQWDDAAEAWHRWGPLLEIWLGAATERMLDAADVHDGSHVLDIAAGAGGQSVIAARRTGPTGRVVATDISTTILAYAAASAADAEIAQMSTLVADAEHLEQLADESFDAVISRLGLIYFPDLQRALAEVHRVLRPGGRIAVIVYSSADRNEFFSVPVSIIRDRAQLPTPLPGQPGPFSLGRDGTLQAALHRAGSRDVNVEPMPSPLHLPSASECVRFKRESFGALHQMLAPVAPEQRQSVWDEIESELSRFETESGFVGPCDLLIGAGSK